jgi:hypothetical protein
MEYFVPETSIVRKIWGKADTILFIFAGASAEFALNKAVDWLYFTGKLPADPIGRLFSTVNYARKIVFSNETDALKAIDTITYIHSAIEQKRGFTIPGWAYRDVLFMLIHYSIAAFELLERKLTETEKADVYDVFLRMGRRMNIDDLPGTYTGWLPVREAHLQNDLANTSYTKDLFNQYKKHLGVTRYKILIEGQKLVVPDIVKKLLNFTGVNWLAPTVPAYKIARLLHADTLIKTLLLPSEYKDQFEALDHQPNANNKPG